MASCRLMTQGESLQFCNIDDKGEKPALFIWKCLMNLATKYVEKLFRKIYTYSSGSGELFLSENCVKVSLRFKIESSELASYFYNTIKSAKIYSTVLLNLTFMTTHHSSNRGHQKNHPDDSLRLFDIIQIILLTSFPLYI